MKHIGCMAVLSILTTVLYAQEFGFGGRLGLTASTLITDDEDVQESLSFVTGGHTDVYVYKMFNKFVGIEGGVTLYQSGFGITYGDPINETIEEQFTYFSIPLSARFKFGYFTLNPGVRSSFLLKAEQDGVDISDQVADTDVSFFVSPGIQFPIGITLNSTVAVGMKNVVKNTDGVNASVVFQFSVGYTFLRKGG